MGGKGGGIERVLHRLRGQASYAYGRTVTPVQGDISPEVLQDPALDEMWKETRKVKAYQAVAKVVSDKVPKEMVRTMSKHPMKEYQSNMERLSVMEKLIHKSWTRIMLMDYTRIVVPNAFREEVMRRKHYSHSGRKKMEESITAKC